MNDGFTKTYNALGHGKFLWRPRRKTETAAEYIGKRDKAIAELYREINQDAQANKSGVDK